MGALSDFIPSGGGLVFLASADISSAATVDFTAFDATKYNAYQFVLANVVGVIDETLQLRTSSDGGATFDSGASDYNYIRVADFQSATEVMEIGGADAIDLTGYFLGSAAGEHGMSGNLYLPGPHLAKYTSMNFLGHYRDSSNRNTQISVAAERNSYASVNAVRFQMRSDNLESGTITMYGLVNG